MPIRSAPERDRWFRVFLGLFIFSGAADRADLAIAPCAAIYLPAARDQRFTLPITTAAVFWFSSRLPRGRLKARLASNVAAELYTYWPPRGGAVAA